MLIWFSWLFVGSWFSAGLVLV